MWQTECTIGTLNADMANKIIFKKKKLWVYVLAFVNHSQFVLSNFWQKDCEIIYGLELLIAPLLRITTFSFLTSIFQSQIQVFIFFLQTQILIVYDNYICI